MLVRTSRYLEPNKQKRMGDARFKNICDVLSELLETSPLSKKDKDFVRDTIKRSNWLQLEEKIKRFLATWDIPMQDIPPAAISDMVVARNVIAHGSLLGEHDKTKDKNAWDIVLQAREVLVRIILLRIGFTGAYQSYPGGQHSRLFPSCTRQ
jgi:hypothetical protein